MVKQGAVCLRDWGCKQHLGAGCALTWFVFQFLARRFSSDFNSPACIPHTQMMLPASIASAQLPPYTPVAQASAFGIF